MMKSSYGYDFLLMIVKPQGSRLQYNRRSKNGFTLIEVLIAIAILAGLALMVSSSWSGNVRRYQKAKINVQAAELLQRKLLEIEARYSKNVPSLPIEQLQTGTFEETRFSDYSWEWEARALELPDLSAMISTDGEDTILVAVLNQFRDYLVASIKEIKVTVKYQKGKNVEPLKFTVATYMVDYNQNISMGMPGVEGLGGGLGNQGGGGNPSGNPSSGGNQ